MSSTIPDMAGSTSLEIQGVEACVRQHERLVTGRHQAGCGSAPADQTRRHRVVVVIDDEVCVRKFLRLILKTAGYEVLEASDGHEGMALIRRNETDLVTTDLFMDGHDGFETIQDLHREFPGVKVIAISGALNPNYLRMAKALGAADFLCKPFSASQLIQAAAQATH